ncbi:hypothetical protein AB0395_21700 [Streptosporangium sp. NPDC051023]|uniref:hypothetical protein n=1 Tax=Streptosporangium sp. NPDC051023 TaxID=3155410 RepID=UPI00344CED87
MLWTPPIGAIGLTYSTGWANVRATIGHTLAGESSHYTQAFIVIDAERVMEAGHCGARVADRRDYVGRYVLYGWLPDLSAHQREEVARAALSLDGVGYSLLDYLIFLRRRMRPERPAPPYGLLPVQLVSETYRRAGINLLDLLDSGEAVVTLSALGEAFMSRREWEMHAPAGRYS